MRRTHWNNYNRNALAKKSAEPTQLAASKDEVAAVEVDDEKPPAKPRKSAKKS